MADKKNSQCPHFGTQDGVCGCPGFWQTTNQGSSLQAVSNTRYAQNAVNNQRSSGVNSIPPSDRTKGPTATPAPPGPVKDTCFLWYHGACRRGSACDRPHEVHPTWPISPPPGFRHFQPCTLPLCPLRTDLQAARTSQENQLPGRGMGGQLDGAAFSRSTTAGESPSDLTGDDNTDTNMSEADDDTSSISDDESVGATALRGSATSGFADHGWGEGADTAVAVKAGKNEFDEADYIDLSTFLSPPSTPLVHAEKVLSISHPGTHSKREQRLSATASPDSSNKHTKIKRGSSPDLENVTSILKRPRTMSQWDIKPPVFALDGQHPEIGVTHTIPTSRTPTLLATRETTNSVPTMCELQPFDPPRGPRSLSIMPPICFFYYHKGYCRPKRGRRCDYLHDASISQQVVSLPYGIDNHDPTCSLPLCPVRLRAPSETSRNPELLAADVTPETKHELSSPARNSGELSFSYQSSSPRDEIMAVRGRPPKGMLGQPLPRLTDMARQRFKEQRKMIKGMQEKSGVGSRADASAIQSTQQAQAGKKTKRSRKRLKKRAKAAERLRQEEEAAQHGRYDQRITSSMQRPLPPLLVKEETPTPVPSLLADDPSKERIGHHGRRRMRSKYAKKRLNGGFNNSEGFREPALEVGYLQNQVLHLQGTSSLLQARDTIGAENQVGGGEVLNMAGPVVRESHQWPPPNVSSQWEHPVGAVMSYEYAPRSLGLTANERRAQRDARRPAVPEVLLLQSEQQTIGLAEDATRTAASNARDEGRDQRSTQEPRYQGHCENEMECGRQSLCQYCEAVGVGADSYFDQLHQNTVDGKGLSACSVQETPAHQLPEGDERLEWDTDLVRRLFGEIE